MLKFFKSRAVIARNYAVYRQHAFRAATSKKPFPLNADSEFVVSMASYPDRIHLVPAVFESLASQSVNPRFAFLVLALEDFPSKKIPRYIKTLEERGVNLVWTQNNPYAVKKLVPVLEMNLGLGIVALDDDMIYGKSALERVVSCRQGSNRTIVGNIGHQLFRKGNELSMFYREREKADLSTPPEVIYLQGCGTYYPPDSLHPAVTDLDAISRIVPGRGSDIWFWAAAKAANSKHACIGNLRQDDGAWIWHPVPQTKKTQPLDRPGEVVLEQRFQAAIDFFGIRDRLLKELPDRKSTGD